MRVNIRFVKVFRAMIFLCVFSRFRVVPASIQEMPSVTKNPLNGKHLRVIWPNWEGNPRGLQGPIKGKVMLQYLTARFNFTYNFVRITENWYEPTNLTRGQFSYLWNDEADLIMGAIQPRSERLKIIDLTYGYVFDGFSILIPVSDEAGSSNTSAVIKPFQLSVWLLFLISIISVTLVFNIVQKLLLHHLPPIRKVDHHKNAIRKETNPYLYVFGNIMSQGGYFTVSRLPIRLIAGTWSLAAFIFVQAYTSTLITYLLAPTTYPLVGSFRELADRPDINVLYRKLASVEFILHSTPNPTGIIEKLKINSAKAFRCNFNSECIKQVKPRTKNVFIETRVFLLDAIKQRFDETKKCDIEIIDNSGLMVAIGCFGLQKHSPYTSAISKGLTELRENGLFDFWDSWFRPIPPQCSANAKGLVEKGAKHPSLRRLSLENLIGAFIVLSIGVGLSFLTFLCEFVAFSTTRRRHDV